MYWGDIVSSIGRVHIDYCRLSVTIVVVTIDTHGGLICVPWTITIALGTPLIIPALIL